MTDRIPEYSFFRAEGLSLAAIETAEEARGEFFEQRKKLEKRFGARGIFTQMDKDTGRLKIDCFVYKRGDKAPEDWNIDWPKEDEDDSYLASGLPKPGSSDAFYLASMAGLMERSAKNMSIENIFGCGDMPMKELPSGKYHGEFVRWTSLEDSGPDAKRVGKLRDRMTICFGSNSACKSSDPIDCMKLDGDWYIRVPNLPGTAEPRFTPPDAVPVSYDRMLEADKAEYNNRYNPYRPGMSGPLC
ncbi:MAG: hypothetical protein EPN97_04480 [Alphaproteobacteria bacterium]|nr:MAG: hypothetical protein EPN97_04480 [Alphaproteobacteria bacterium]